MRSKWLQLSLIRIAIRKIHLNRMVPELVNNLGGIRAFEIIRRRATVGSQLEKNYHVVMFDINVTHTHMIMGV